jgi:hypothetical protein
MDGLKYVSAEILPKRGSLKKPTGEMANFPK